MRPTFVKTGKVKESIAMTDMKNQGISETTIQTGQGDPKATAKKKKVAMCDCRVHNVQVSKRPANLHQVLLKTRKFMCGNYLNDYKVMILDDDLRVKFT